MKYACNVVVYRRHLRQSALGFWFCVRPLMLIIGAFSAPSPVTSFAGGAGQDSPANGFDIASDRTSGVTAKSLQCLLENTDPELRMTSASRATPRRTT
jgi:hypothetical protein